MSAPNTTPTREYLKPPVTEVGVLGWLHGNLFNTWYNSVLTILFAVVLWQVVPPFISWAFIDSVWNTPSEACRDIEGACWSIIPQNISFIIFGFFPDGEQWRPGSAMLILLGLVFFSKNSNHWKKSLGVYWLIGLIVMGTLMYGGVFGMQVVETAQWSGLPLTFMLSFFGMVAAYPLGVLLALGRQSKMPAIKTLCVVYIEMIRGVPLISLLFMSSIMFPLFLPDHVHGCVYSRGRSWWLAGDVTRPVRSRRLARPKLQSNDAADYSTAGAEDRHSAVPGYLAVSF